jgi:hypothetical protein
MGVTAIANAFQDQAQRDILNLLFDELTAVRKMLGAATGGTGAGALVGSETYDTANLVDGAGATSTGATVTGAALGDLVLGSMSVDEAGITVTHYVSAADTCKTRIQNESGGAVDLASATIRYLVIPSRAVAQALAAMLLTKT